MEPLIFIKCASRTQLMGSRRSHTHQVCIPYTVVGQWRNLTASSVHEHQNPTHMTRTPASPSGPKHRPHPSPCLTASNPPHRLASAELSTPKPVAAARQAFLPCSRPPPTPTYANAQFEPPYCGITSSNVRVGGNKFAYFAPISIKLIDLILCTTLCSQCQ